MPVLPHTIAWQFDPEPLVTSPTTLHAHVPEASIALALFVLPPDMLPVTESVPLPLRLITLPLLATTLHTNVRVVATVKFPPAVPPFAAFVTLAQVKF
jgi:hypothetical protein